MASRRGRRRPRCICLVTRNPLTGTANGYVTDLDCPVHASKPAPLTWDYALVRAGVTVDMGDHEAFASFLARWLQDASLDLTRMDAAGHLVTLVGAPAALRYDAFRSEAKLEPRYPCQWLDERGWITVPVKLQAMSGGSIVNVSHAARDPSPSHERLHGYRVTHAAGPWLTKDGRFIEVVDMDDAHLQNAAAMLARSHCITSEEAWHTDCEVLTRRCWSMRLSAEMDRRGLEHFFDRKISD